MRSTGPSQQAIQQSGLGNLSLSPGAELTEALRNSASAVSPQVTADFKQVAALAQQQRNHRGLPPSS